MSRQKKDDPQRAGRSEEQAHFGAMLGFERMDSPEDTALFELKLRPEHCNLYGTVHGGVVMSMLDAAGLWAGAYRDGALLKASTAALNCNFLRGARLGPVVSLKARGEVTKRGKSIYFCSSWVYAYPGDDLIASGQGVYALAPGEPLAST